MRWPWTSKNGASAAVAGPGRRERIIEPGILGIEDYFGISMEAKAEGGGRIRGMVRKGEIEDSIYSDSAVSFEGQTPIGLDAYQAQYGNSLWVFTAVSAIAQKLGSVRIVAGRHNGADFEDEPESLLQELIDRPHPNLSQSAFVQLWATFFELAGSDLIALLRDHGNMRDNMGPLTGLLPLRPSRIEIEPGNNFARWFIHRLDAGRYSEVYIHPDNACFTRSPNPSNDFWGLSKVGVVSREIELDKVALRYNDSSLRKGGVPAAKIETDSPITERLRNRIKRYYQTIFGNADRNGDVVVLSHGLKLTPAGFSPKDMQFLELTETNSRRILRMWKVPPVVAGLFAEASVLANADAQVRLFYENAVVPAGDFLVSCLNASMRNVLEIKVGERRERLNPRDRWGFRFAWEDVDALKDDDGPRIDRARLDYEAGVITIQELRAVQQLPPIEGFDDSRRIAEPSVLPVLVQGRIVTPNEARRALALPPISGGDEFREPSISDFLQLSASRDPISHAMIPGLRGPAFAHSETAKRLGRASLRSLVRAWLPRSLADTRSALSEQLERVLDRLTAVDKSGPDTTWNRAKRAAREQKGIDDVLLSLLFPTDEEAALWRNKTAPGHLLTILAAGEAKLEGVLDPELQFAIDERSTRIQRYMDSVFASRVQKIQETTREKLRAILQESFAQSERPFDTKKRIVDLWREMGEGPSTAGSVESRAERIARTELHTALSKGSFESLQQAADKGATILKSWLWSGISRQDHAALQSSTGASPIPLTERFANGLLHPHEPGAPPDQSINCGCSTIEHIVRPPNPEAGAQ